MVSSSASSGATSVTASTTADAMIRSSYFEVSRHHPPAATTNTTTPTPPSSREMIVGPSCVRGATVPPYYESSLTKASAAAVTVPVLPESIKQNYCDVVKRVLLKHGATSRSTSVKLSWIGEQCPKPHPLMKIRPVLEECADLAVEQDPHDKLVQHLWVRVLPAVDEAAKQQYLHRVKSYLLKSGAVDQSSAALLTWVGDACPKPLELPKLRALLEESPEFAMAADPLKPQRQLVWLKGEDGFNLDDGQHTLPHWPLGRSRSVLSAFLSVTSSLFSILQHPVHPLVISHHNVWQMRLCQSSRLGESMTKCLFSKWLPKCL